MDGERPVMPDLVLRMTIPGDPIPKGRPRFAHGHAYTPRRTRQAERAIAILARTHLSIGERWPVDGPLAITLSFHCRRASDLDNLIKLVADTLQGVVYKNDRQIVVLNAARHDASKDPRTEIAVHRMGQ
jgi:Holliday junction resolvase RusA-like endonuclease